MSFRTTFCDPEKHSVWFRTISALSAVRKEINFTITSAEFIMWTINTTDTTLCQARFSRNFFEEYEFKPYEIAFGEDGIQVLTDSNGNDRKLYSFETSGKHLTTISKKPDGDSVKEFTIAINNAAGSPEVLANRLLIRIETSSLISKDYTPQFTPIKYDPIVVDLKYKRKFLEVYGSDVISMQEMLDPRLSEIFAEAKHELSTSLFNQYDEPTLEDTNQSARATEINLICCNQTLIKNFVDNCNPNVTEEMKLEVNDEKLCVTAFTKSVYGKNNDILRNGISLSNTINTSDLECHCLMKDKRDESTKSIVFKLKDFKNFMSIWSSSKTGSTDNLNMWFCNRGEPLLVEFNRPDIRFELVQITDSGDMVGDEYDNVVTKEVSPSKILNKDKSKEGLFFSRITPLKPSSVSGKEIRRSPLKAASDSIPNNKNNVKRRLFIKEEDEHALSRWNQYDEKLTREQLEHEDESGPTAQAERSRTTIGWGKRSLERDTSVKTIDKQSMLKQEKRKYLQGIKDEQKRQKSEPDNNVSTYETQKGLGPTQPTKPKGLFD